jgi:transposase-like protein
MTDHLGYEPGAQEGQGSGNSRNGTGRKTLRTDQGDVTVEVPRDRNGTFEPKLVKKHQRSFKGFDDKILSMYARGMSVRDIQPHLAEIYGTEVSPDLISRVTDAVIDEVQAWQAIQNARRTILVVDRSLHRDTPYVSVASIDPNRHPNRVMCAPVFLAGANRHDLSEYA